MPFEYRTLFYVNLILTLVSTEEIHVLHKNMVTECTSLDMFGFESAQKECLKLSQPLSFWGTGSALSSQWYLPLSH